MNYFPLISAGILLTCGLIAAGIAVPLAIHDGQDPSNGGIHGSQPLEVEIIENYGPSYVIHPPGNIQLQSYVANGDGELIYSWQTEGGTILSGDPNPTIEINEEFPGGDLTIILNVEDEDGDTGSDSFTIEIGAPTSMIQTITVDIGNEFPDREGSSGTVETHTPALLFAFPRIDGPPPVEVSFTATLNWISIYSYYWDFGDGSDTYTGSSTSHIYETPGNFSVTVSNGTQNDPDNLTLLAAVDIIIMDEEPDDGISIDMDLPHLPGNQTPYVFDIPINATPSRGLAPLYVNFNHIMAPAMIEGFLWTFGDGGPISFDRSTSRVFVEPGTYHVTVTYSSIIGIYGYGEIDIVVDDPNSELLNVEIEVIPTEYSHSFRLIAHPSLEVSLSYDWTFLHEPSDSGEDILHHFQTYGMNYAEVHVYNEDLDLNTTSRVDIFIPHAGAPSVHFLIHPTIGDPAYFQFEPIVGGGVSPYTYFWYFGDGTSSSEESPTHYYYDEGYYKVELFVEDGDGRVGYYSDHVYAYSSMVGEF